MFLKKAVCVKVCSRKEVVLAAILVRQPSWSPCLSGFARHLVLSDHEGKGSVGDFLQHKWKKTIYKNRTAEVSWKPPFGAGWNDSC